MGPTPDKYRMAIAPSDQVNAENIFAAQSRDIAKIAFHYNSDLKRWELYEVDLRAGTLVASVRVADNVKWQEE